MENKKQEKRSLLNFFDIIIIILVILAAGAFIIMQMRGSSQYGGDTGSETIEYQVEITGIYENTQGMINVGDSIVDKVKKYNIGTVKDVEYYPYKREAIDYDNGAVRYTEVPGKLSACITVTAECTRSDGNITVDGGFHVKAGEQMSIVGPGYAGGGYIIGVTRGDD